MARALALFLFLLPFCQGVQAQVLRSVNCDATEVVFDFGAPGPLTFQGGYPVANMAGYLHLFDAGPLRFLPTRVVGGMGYRVWCTVSTQGFPKLRQGSDCGQGFSYCFRITEVSGTLPLDPNTRLYVMVQVVLGQGIINHVPIPTPLGNIPDNRGLASIPRNTVAALWIYFFAAMDPNDTLEALPASGTLTFTYGLEDD